MTADEREAMVAAESILSLLHYRGIVDSEYNREDVKNALAKLRAVMHRGDEKPIPVSDHPPWPMEGEHLWSQWLPDKGLPNPTQYRMCLHPMCNRIERRDAARA